MESKCVHSLFSPIAPSPHPLLQPAQSLCPFPGPHPQDTHTCLHKVPALELPHPPHLPPPTPPPVWEGPTSPAASSMGQSQVPYPRVYRPKFCLQSAPVTFGSDGVICVFPFLSSLVAQMVKNPPAMQETFNPWVRKIPWRREWKPTPVSLPRESRGQRSLVGYSLWGPKESHTTELLTLFSLTQYKTPEDRDQVCLCGAPNNLLNWLWFLLDQNLTILWNHSAYYFLVT